MEFDGSVNGGWMTLFVDTNWMETDYSLVLKIFN
jgi:hypothetical protein